MKTITVALGDRSYPIYLGASILDDLPGAARLGRREQDRGDRQPTPMSARSAPSASRAC